MEKQAIYIQINPEAIEQELRAAPKQITDQAMTVYNLNRQKENAKLDLDMRRNEIFSEVTDKVNPATGKPAFSNDAARQAETAKRCKGDVEYQGYLQKYQAAEQAWNIENDKLTEQKNKFLSNQCISEIVAAQLNFWAGEVERAVDFRKTA